LKPPLQEALSFFSFFLLKIFKQKALPHADSSSATTKAIPIPNLLYHQTMSKPSPNRIYSIHELRAK